MTPFPFLHPSGGLTYHLRALRHGRGLWRGYRLAVADWLGDWHPGRRELLLLGPSGGYSLPTGWLNRFDRVLAVEPDPLARLLLAHRHVHPRLAWERPGENLLDVVERHPRAAILFCNLLGQNWQGAGDEVQRAGLLASLTAALGERPWASYHDVVSTTVPPRLCGPLQDDSEHLETLLGRFWSGGELPLVDHGTHILGAGRPARYVVWRLTPRRYHLVGWVEAGGHSAKPPRMPVNDRETSP